jgi:propionate kinase
MAGIADGINTEKALFPSTAVSQQAGSPRLRRRWAIALELEKRDLIDSVALIGHRIAHGGNLFTESSLLRGGYRQYPPGVAAGAAA